MAAKPQTPRGSAGVGSRAAPTPAAWGARQGGGRLVDARRPNPGADLQSARGPHPGEPRSVWGFAAMLAGSGLLFTAD